MKEIRGELFVSLVLIALLGIVFNPWNTAMPDFMIMSLLLGLVVIFTVFAVFVWRENHGDEREVFHRHFADRIGYLAGSAFLLLAIVVEELNHALDRWLVAALAVMVLGKVAGLIYGKMKL